MRNSTEPYIAPPLRSKLPITGLLIVLVALIITLVAIVANISLRRIVEENWRTEISLIRIEGLTYHLSALEWQAIGELGLSSEIVEDVQNTRDEMSRILDSLDQLDPNTDHLRSVLQTYNSALDKEFKAITDNNFAQAKLFDLEQVDPSFDALVQLLTSTREAYQAKANQVAIVSNVGFAVVPLLSTVALAVLFWRTEKALAAAEVAGAEQKALVRSQEAFRLLNEMGNWLQACHTAAEAYDVIANFSKRLFPNESGAWYIYNLSRNIIEAVAIWGNFPPRLSEQVLLPDACWALRRGQTYVVKDTRSHEVLCQHLGEPKPDSYLCVPMMAQGETLGILHLRHTNPLQVSEAQSSDSPIESTRQLAMTVSEHVALALVNLTLKASLRNQAIRDPLTGMFNRRYMEETLERELARALRRNAPVGIVMLDIDHFKLFNDMFGHPAGDKILIELSRLIHEQFRGEDIPCRYGGEEFVLILPEASLDNVYRRAEQLREDAQHLSVQYNGQLLGTITLSFGLASFPEHGRTGESILAAADVALYRAKAEGRNRLVVAQVSKDEGEMSTNIPHAGG